MTVPPIYSLSYFKSLPSERNELIGAAHKNSAVRASLPTEHRDFAAARLLAVRRPRQARGLPPINWNMTMLTNEQTERAAAILEQIDRLGRELLAIMNTIPYEEHFNRNNDTLRQNAYATIDYFAIESLCLDPEDGLTPAQMAKALRSVV
jgi:hypothetical protein